MAATTAPSAAVACFSCAASGATTRCARCKSAWYCDASCQKVPEGALNRTEPNRTEPESSRGAESCERRWGNQPGNLPVGVAPVGLVGVVAGASIDSMGLLPSQKGAVQRLVSPVAI